MFSLSLFFPLSRLSFLFHSFVLFVEKCLCCVDVDVDVVVVCCVYIVVQCGALCWTLLLFLLRFAVVVMSLTLVALLHLSTTSKTKTKKRLSFLIHSDSILFDSLKMQSMDRDLARFLLFISVFHQRNTIILNIMICLRREREREHDHYMYAENAVGISCNRLVSLFVCLFAWFVLILDLERSNWETPRDRKRLSV